jgi:hypothetical protein
MFFFSIEFLTEECTTDGFIEVCIFYYYLLPVPLVPHYIYIFVKVFF